MLCITVKQTTVLTQVISVKNLLLFVLFLYDKIKPFIKTLNRNFFLIPLQLLILIFYIFSKLKFFKRIIHGKKFFI